MKANYVDETIQPYPDLLVACENKIKTHPELSSLKEY
jgi:hypothetical protein